MINIIAAYNNGYLLTKKAPANVQKRCIKKSRSSTSSSSSSPSSSSFLLSLSTNSISNRQLPDLKEQDITLTIILELLITHNNFRNSQCERISQKQALPLRLTIACSWPGPVQTKVCLGHYGDFGTIALLFLDTQSIIVDLVWM